MLRATRPVSGKGKSGTWPEPVPIAGCVKFQDHNCGYEIRLRPHQLRRPDNRRATQRTKTRRTVIPRLFSRKSTGLTLEGAAEIAELECQARFLDLPSAVALWLPTWLGGMVTNLLATDGANSDALVTEPSKRPTV